MGRNLEPYIEWHLFILVEIQNRDHEILITKLSNTKLDVPLVSVTKSTPSDNYRYWKIGFQSTKSGAGLQFLPLNCRARARREGVFFHRHRHHCCSYLYTYGQFSTNRYGNMRLAPRSFEPSEGMFRLMQAVVLGFVIRGGGGLANVTFTARGQQRC